MLKKLLIVAALFVLVFPLALPTANAQGPDFEISNEYAGTEIRVIFANHPWASALQQVLPEFEAASGITVRLESYFEDQLSQKLQIGLTSGSSQADVFMFRPLQEGLLFEQNGWVADLTEFAMNDEGWDYADFQAGPLGTVISGEVLFGVPIVTERQALYYRADLFEEAGIEVPQTLEELEAAAAALTDRDNNMYGIALRGQRSAAVTQFSSFLYSFGGEWIDEDGNSAINSPEAFEAYDYYGRLLREYGPPGGINMHWPQAIAVFAQGNAAMYLDADILYTNVVDPNASVVVDSVAFAPFPEGPAGRKPYSVTSWAIGMNSGSMNKDAAWEFIRWATSPEIVRVMQAEQGQSGARASVWGSPDGLGGFPADLAEAILVNAEVGVGFDRPRVIRVGEARDIVGLPIVVSIEGGDLAAALEEAHASFQAFLEEERAGID
ncbi:MAG: sugar ABC transporter substrate-binding protein [Anaerolineae bacterium]|nr:sugar ABC transporter substrate-binding protein [Anaerolineae bacterium]